MRILGLFKEKLEHRRMRILKIKWRYAYLWMQSLNEFCHFNGKFSAKNKSYIFFQVLIFQSLDEVEPKCETCQSVLNVLTYVGNAFSMFGLALTIGIYSGDMIK